MKFSLVKHEEITTHHYPPAVAETVTETKIVRTYDAADGGDVFTQFVGFKKRRRRFLIEQLEITWTRKAGEDFRRRWVTATGRTVLSDGNISPRSTGYQSWWPHEEMPHDIAVLVAQDDNRIMPAGQP